MTKPMNPRRGELVAALAPLFALLHQQGRMDKWLADQLGISKQRLSSFKHGVNFMPQRLYDEACRLLDAPRDIRLRRVPVARPGYYDRQKPAAKKGA